MSDESQHSRLKYFISYILAMAAAFATFKTFYLFEAGADFGIQMISLNFGIVLLLWFLSFVHTHFIKNNIFMVLILPFIGLQTTNLLFVIMSPAASFTGYISFLISSATLIFISYKARRYEKNL